MLLAVSAAICVAPGLALLLVPAPFMGAVYGLSLDAGGAFLARILGASLIALAALYWSQRGVAPSPSLRMVLITGLIYNVIEAVATAPAAASGLLNVVGWLAVALHAALAAAFALALRSLPRRG